VLTCDLGAMSSKHALAMVVCMAVWLCPALGAGQGTAADEDNPFAQGRVALSLTAGTSFVGPDTYLLLGAGINYYVVDGLALGFGGLFWLLDDPFIGTLTPDITYVFHFVQTVRPYVGSFVRHYFVGDGIGDFNSIGARAGINILPPESRFYFGIGAVYEHLFDCDEDLFECDDVYPEMFFAISF
jgi:hypothetical protein